MATAAKAAPAKAPKRKALKIPKSLGACVDLLHATREERLVAQKIVDAIEADEKALRAHLIDNVDKNSVGAMGKAYKAVVYNEEVPQVEDWDRLYAYIKKTGSFELLGKRLNNASIKDRWEDKKQVPGVKSFTAVKLSVTKI